MSASLSDFLSIFARFRTWYLMGNQDIQMRYRRSLIGPFWISISMATMVFALGLLFSQVQQQPFREFLSYFGCGLVAWTFLSTMMNEGCTSVMDNEGNLRSLPLPVPMLTARMVYRNLVIMAHNMLVVGIMLALFGQGFTPAALSALPALALYVPIGLFFGVALGPICARFRDLPQVIASILQIAFFMTPIFWMPGSRMERHVLVELNPFYHLIEIVRRPLLGEAPELVNWTVSLAVLGVVMTLAAISLPLTRKRVFLWL